MFALARTLRERGVLSLNRRNAEYVLPYNPRRLYHLVDDKLETKRLAQKLGLPVPTLYGVIRYAGEVSGFAKVVADHKSFAIKPSQGAGGDGIIVITGRSKQLYRSASGKLYSESDLHYHLHNTLSGIYSLGGQPDKVLIEYCVQFDPAFEKIAYQGVPDIRVIVFFGVPVMAMVRLPTRMSGGRANLHMGAIGAGVDLATGTTLTAVWGNDVITEHPDTANPVSGMRIPSWDRILDFSARSHELTGLGYQGVDIVLDREIGPLILELNARPGLNIQIANRAGLAHRLKKVEETGIAEAPRAERIAFAKEHFAAGK